MQVRALVCGSNYGRYYVDAIGLAPDRFHLAGILARSSNRSQRLAQRYGVPLYRTTSELPDQIDLACAAMSSSAAPVVLQLLERGIHVLCEHPQRPRFLREALDLAGQRQVRFHVNGHFPDLPAPRSFITRCQQLHQAQPVRLLHIMVTDRTLYTGLDIVIRAIGDDRVEDVAVTGRVGSSLILQGTFAGTEAALTVQTGGADNRALVDGSPEYLLDCRITAGFASGVLTLLSLAGPVVWSSNSGRLRSLDDVLWSVTSGAETSTAGQLLEQRHRANLASLEHLLAPDNGEPPLFQRRSHLLGVSAAWEQLGRLLPTA